MPFKKDRNSRDDKSNNYNKSARSEQGSSQNNRSNSDRPEGSNSGKKKLFGSDSKRPFKSDSDKPGYKGDNRSSSRSAFDGDRSEKKPYNSDKSFGDKPYNKDRSFGSDDKRSDRKPFGDKKPYGSRPSEGDRKPYGDRPQGERKSFGSRSNDGERKPFGNRSNFDDNKGERKSFGDKPQGERKPYGTRSTGDSDRKPYGTRSSDGERKPYSDRNSGERKPYDRRPSEGNDKGERKPFSDRSSGERKPFGKSDRSSDQGGAPKRFNDKPFKSRSGYDDSKSFDDSKFKKDDRKWSSEERLRSNNRSKKPAPDKEDDGLIRLNRYIANAGICSRRKADDLISAGVVSVNGEAVTELGFKVDPYKDTVRYNGEALKREKMVYVLLNKPKDYITTTDDPQERKTVMSLVEKSSKERIYPVGRLDRNTTGLLLMTNDGDLAEKLSHPRNNVTKIYQVELNKNLSQGDLNKIGFGLELEDGLIKPDHVSYVTGGSKNEIGIQIHSGKNRIVRRIFESLGYEVVKLDRVVYSQLTKKDLPRGRWRYLEEKEVIMLKHLIKS